MKSPLQVLSHSLVIAWKDLTEFRRNRITLIFSLIMPIMMMGMFGYIFQDSASALNNVPVGMIVDDLGIYGEQISSMIRDISSNSDSIQLIEVSTRTQAEEKILSAEIKAAIIIPNNFTSSIQGQNQAKIIIVTDPSNPTIAQALTQFFNGIISVLSDQFSQELIETGMPYFNSEFVVNPISINAESIVSGGGSSFDFVAPGIIAMNVMMSGLSALGAALARERESGTLDGILMSPISRTSIILGKTVSHTIRNLFQGGITIAIAVLIFGVTIRGNPLLIVFILILGTISFLGLGIIATAIAKEQESAQLILGLLQFPMMFLSGVLFPIEQMPPILQTVSKVLPLTYAVEALRKVMILGVGFEAIILPITILVILGVVTMTLGVPLF
ncbi:MAG: ABC transporter permease, partial [Candidatus Bathyarchaeia archaeon]